MGRCRLLSSDATDVPAVRAKFREDYEGVGRHRAAGFAFFVNQPLTLAERAELIEISAVPVEIYHLERMRLILDSPKGYGLRLEFLRRAMAVEEQVVFFNELNQSFTNRLLSHERRLADISPKIDTILERTTALYDAVVSRPSSLLDSLSTDFVGEPLSPTSALSVATLALIHRLSMATDPRAQAMAGRFRSVQVWVGDPSDPIYEPPPPDEVPSRLVALLGWWRGSFAGLAENGRDVPSVVEALASLHYGIVSIHPFLDGNGRVARILTDQAALDLLDRRVGPELTSSPSAATANL